MKKYMKAFIRIFCFSILAAGAAACCGQEPDSGVFINEVCSFNESTKRDSDRKYSDYIELYNNTDEEISLKGWRLSDDKDALDKAKLPDVSIGAGEYALFYANGKDGPKTSIAFRINSEGETIFLSDPEGNIADSIRVPRLEADTVYARTEDGSGRWARMEPSPNASNAGSGLLKNPILEEPVFSHSSGFYDEPFELEISAKQGGTIYYTLDGSEPTEESEVYTGAIPIGEVSGFPNVYNSVQNVVPDWKNYTPPQEPVDKAVVVRAAVIDHSNNASGTVTATFFVGLDQYQDADVLCLTADPDDLFGENGIYVTGKEYDDWYLSGSAEDAPVPNFQKTGRHWEIEGSISFFESGELVTEQKAGIRIQGLSTRQRAKKRFSIYSRRAYSGSDYFDCEFFEGDRTHSIALREGFADAYLPSLVEDRDIATQNARPAVVFLNGEYWYTTYIKEKYGERYLNREYGVDPHNVLMIKNWEAGAGDEADYEIFEDFLQYLLERISSGSGASYEEMEQIMDVQSFIDYMCANIYLHNVDLEIGNNSVFWRTVEDEGTEYGDCRWRWMMYDLDAIEWSRADSYGAENLAEVNSFTAGEMIGEQMLTDYPVFAVLKDDETFRKQFVLTFMDMVNTDFSLKAVEEKLAAGGEDLTWKDGFFAKRADYIVPCLAEEFHLTGTLEEICLEINDPQAGCVQVNTCTPDLSEKTWTGAYYTDYPVTLTAAAADGYRFAGWEGGCGDTEETITVDLREGGVKLKAVFEKE